MAAVRAAFRAVTIGVALLAVGSVGLAGTLVLVVSARARTEALEGRLNALRSELARAQTAVAELDRQRRERAEMEKRLEALQGKLPVERAIPSLYRSLHDAAFATGLAVSLFQPREARPLEAYTEIPISLTVEGAYHHFGRFLERLAGLSPLAIVTTFKLSRLERSPTSVRADMTLATYTYRPSAPGARVAASGSEPGAVTPSPTTARARESADPPAYAAGDRRDPFAGGVPLGPEQLDPSARRGAALASAVLRGIVRGRESLLALVETPDGHGYVLRPGDSLDDARLVAIGRDAVVFQLPPRPGLADAQVALALGEAR